MLKLVRLAGRLPHVYNLLSYLAAVASGRGEIEVDGHRIPVALLPDGGRAADVDRALRSR